MGATQQFLNGFNKYFERIDKELRLGFKTRIPIFDDIGKHSLFNEGKRLRPLLFVLSSQLCGYRGDDMYRLSTIFEYLHTASLLHDDVMDNADIRRNKPSASHVWGNSAAVLTGDYLSSLCSSLALSTNNLDLMKVLIETSASMSEGQALELVHTGDWNVSKEQYMEIITCKTASLIAAACKCGGIISNIALDMVENLDQFGLNLGISFQLIDDLLDYTSSQEEFGKPVGKDIREKKMTLPLIYTLSSIEKHEKEKIQNLLNKDQVDDEDYELIIVAVRKSNAVDQVKDEAKAFTDKAVTYLDAFDQSPVRDDLVALNRFLINRYY